MCLRKGGDSCPHVVYFCTSGHRQLALHADEVILQAGLCSIVTFFHHVSNLIWYKHTHKAVFSCTSVISAGKNSKSLNKCFTASPVPLTLFPPVFQMPVPGCPSVPRHSGLCCPPLPLRHGHAAEDELQRPRGAAAGAARGGLLHRDGNRWVPEGFWGEFEAFVPSVALISLKLVVLKHSLEMLSYRSLSHSWLIWFCWAALTNRAAALLDWQQEFKEI